MSDTLFSLSNELPTGSASRYLELNPAVLSTDRDICFALSAVYVGPEMEPRDQPMSLEVNVDQSTCLLRAVAQKSKSIKPGEDLTVALFSVTRKLLERISTAHDVEVTLGFGAHTLKRQLAPLNQENVARFLLDHAPDITSFRSTATLAAGAVA